jgi:hypothetical protein
MSIHLRVNRLLLYVFSLFLVFPGFGVITEVKAQGTAGTVQWNSPSRVPSPESTSSWFPDLAVDSKGRVHLVWNESVHFNVTDGDYSQIESVYYSMWDGQEWSLYNDLIPAQQDIIRTSIAVDSYDILHLLFDYSPPYGLYYKQAPADNAYAASSWSEQRLVNEKAFTYMSDIGIYQDTLHIVYDDQGLIDDQCEMCADVYYRHSTDLGLSWSSPIALSPTGTGSSHPRIDIDRSGVLYVSWDEGWDRLTGHGEPIYGIFMISRDGGVTWSSPLNVTDPASNNAQLTVGSDGRGGVMLVWRTTSPSYPEIYYMWSSDWGENWTSPESLPGIVARDNINQFDIYDIASDSQGHIHLLATGNLLDLAAPSTEESKGTPGLYHFEWDGSRWAGPTAVYEGAGGPNIRTWSLPGATNSMRPGFFARILLI